MKFSTCLTLFAATALVACSSGAAEDDEAAAIATYSEEFMPSCIAGASGSGASEAYVESLCACALELVLPDLNLDEPTGPNPQRFDEIVNECLAR